MNSSIALKTITATPHLLTTFTPPTSCWESLYYPTITQGLAAYQPGDDFHPADIYPFLDASCYPPGHTYSPGYTSTNPDGLKTFYTYAWLYSPGLFCPWGYTTPSNGFETTVGLTLTFCCPSNYEWEGSPYLCSSSGTEWTWIGSASAAAVAVVTERAVLHVDPVTLAAGVVDQPTGNVVIQNTDPDLVPSTGRAIPSTPAATDQASTSSSTATAEAIPTQDQGLAQGGTAGVAIGVVAGFIVVLSAAISLYRYHRARQIEGREKATDIAGFFARAKRRSRQGPPTEIYELESKEQAGEADAMNVIVELKGEWRGNELGDR